MDYKTCSDEDMVEHVMSKSHVLISKMRKYHLDRGNTDVVEKIDKARLQARVLRLQQKMG